jgi:hypothetical protein
MQSRIETVVNQESVFSDKAVPAQVPFLFKCSSSASAAVPIKKFVPSECIVSQETMERIRDIKCLYVHPIPNALLFSHIKTKYKTDQVHELMDTLSSVFAELVSQITYVQNTNESKYKITHINEKTGQTHCMFMVIYANKKDKTNSCNLVIEFEKTGYLPIDKMIIARLWHYIKEKIDSPDKILPIPLFDTLGCYIIADGIADGGIADDIATDVTCDDV